MAHNGRSLKIDWDSTELVGVRSKSISTSNEYADVTSDEDGGWRMLLENPTLRAVEITVSGVTKDEVLLAAIYEANMTSTTLTATLPTSLTTAGSLVGDFLISSYEQSGEHDGSYDFSATFMSTGEFTYTPSS